MEKVGKGISTVKILDFKDLTAPSKLEKEYLELYGSEFVGDLKNAYRYARCEVRKQPPEDAVISRRRRTDHEIGDWYSVFYVDFRNENLYSLIVDDMGGKTLHNHGHSPCLRAKDNRNLRYLLSGLYLYDGDKTEKWLNKLLGSGEKFWVERV